MRIKDMSAATGVEGQTVRYCEKLGLLPQPARSANGYRSYESVHLQRLAFIRHCRALDMPLSDSCRCAERTADLIWRSTCAPCATSLRCRGGRLVVAAR